MSMLRLLFVAIAAFVSMRVAHAQTFTNSTTITYAGGNATPTSAYPSVLFVNGVASAPYFTLTINGLASSFGGADVVALLLVSPTGAKIDLGALGAGSATFSATYNITFADDAAAQLLAPAAASGTYLPGMPIGAPYPAPAPGGPYTNTLASVPAGSVNGTWLLYVLGNGNSRTVASGWSLNFNGARQPQPIGTSFTYQGRLVKAGVAVNGTADLRFTLWNSATSTITGNRSGGPITRSGINVVNGLFTTTLDFGGATDDPNALWLEIEAASPPGSGYVVVGPRQRITPTPQAVRASVASTAETFSVTSDARLGDKTMFLRSGSDTNHGLGWFSTNKPFAGIAPDGAVLFGYGGGVLGSKDGQTERATLRWTNTSRVLLGLTGFVDGPAARLHIQGDSTNDLGLLVSSFGAGWGSGIRLENTAASTGRTYGMYSGNDGNWYFADQSATATRMLINKDGRIGVGTTAPGVSFDVVGGVRARGGGPGGFGANNNGYAFSSPGDDDSGFFSLGDNQVSIVNNATEVVRVTGGNVGIGTTTPSQRLTVNGNVLANNVAVPSSGRFKDHVAPMSDALDALLKLEGVRFDWKPEWAAQRPGREHDIGFVAEDVAKVFPEVVFRDAEGNVTGMDYSRLTAVAVEAIKQQQARFDARLKSGLEAKQREIDELRQRLERLETARGK